jgi:cytochrome c553
MRLRIFVLLAGLVGLSSLAAEAMPSAYQELTEATQATPNLDRGAQYFTTCANCHGPKGGGKVDGKVPRIGGQYAHVIARQLVAFRHGQRWDILMENFADQHRLPDAQAIADVSAYVAQLDDPYPPGMGSGELVSHGASIYFRMCESCHGSSGQGNSKHLVPKIAGQHYEYLRRQIYDAVDGRRPGFPASHVRLLARLDHDDIAGVADYLSRIAPHYAAEPLIIPGSAQPKVLAPYKIGIAAPFAFRMGLNRASPLVPGWNCAGRYRAR